MKLVISALTLILLSFNISSSQILQNDTYQYFVDLNKADNDQLEIELITPVISTVTTEFKLPAMVPGTYKVYNFGRFISGLKAFDNSGNELKTEKKDIDSWEISNADKLYRLKYFVDDSLMILLITKFSNLQEQVLKKIRSSYLTTTDSSDISRRI
ncbi:MAG: hypothetical protein IPG09_02855 [Ignavibacteria bacterium]|nr:hypothetical protein [Ignavibacteria bacterium]